MRLEGLMLKEAKIVSRLALVLLFWNPGGAFAGGQSDNHPAADARREFIRRAQVWAPVDIAAVDFKTGPTGRDAFQLNEMVTCDYVQAKLSGHTRKFACALG